MKNVLKGYRIMLGYTQKEMAGLLDISRQSYHMKENLKVPFTDYEKIVIRNEVATLFPDISIDEIFFKNELGFVSYGAKERR
ncbi:transcriptional regulator [Aerococcaceae bacterium DSM 111176]|nr:transcriptional regulator [Aerococcaceae bacterium DSM 111176]